MIEGLTMEESEFITAYRNASPEIKQAVDESLLNDNLEPARKIIERMKNNVTKNR